MWLQGGLLVPGDEVLVLIGGVQEGLKIMEFFRMEKSLRLSTGFILRLCPILKNTPCALRQRLELQRYCIIDNT